MKKIIHIFDMDDTLLVTPTLSDTIKYSKDGVIDTEKHHPKFFKKMKAAFWDRFSKNVEFVISGDFIIVVDSDTKKPLDGGLFKTYFPEKKWDYFFEIKQNKILLRSLPEFYSQPNSLGNQKNEDVINIYNSVDNKMILTGRDEKMRNQIESHLKDIKLEFPNYGLHLYPGKPSIKDYKCNTILNTINDNGWEEVHFYEDRPDWLHYAEGVIKEKHPDVKFVPHHITSVHNEKTF